MRRVDPLVVLTLLGLVAAGALAALHPVEGFDPSRDDQVGRMVSVTFQVWRVDHGESWSRGEALPEGVQGSLPVEWVWFRPPESRPQVGDRVEGRARVEPSDSGAGLVLSGPHAAIVTEGPHPVAVRWRDLADHPEHYADRLLVMNGRIDADHLVEPTGGASCRLATPAAPHPEPERWLVRLTRDSDPLAWLCRLEGRAP